jgi:hypothetical protein
MPTATDLVTDLPADFEVFGQAVDTRLKALQPGTTLGDLAYSSATANTNTRLGIGTTGQILTVSGGVPAWSTPASGGTKNFSLLNTGGTALSGSTTVTVSGISNADVIFVYISGASGGTGAYNVSFRVNGLTTGIYNYQGPYINAGAGYSAANFGVRGGNSEVRATIGEWSGDPGSTMSGWFRITGAATSGQKIIDFQTGAIASGSSGQDLVWGGGYIDTSAAITSISLIQDDGINFDAGTIRVYTSA